MAKESRNRVSLKILKALLLIGLVSIIYSSVAAAEEGEDPFAETPETSFSEFSDGGESDDMSGEFEESDEANETERAALEWTGFLEIEQGSHFGEKSTVDRNWVLSNRRFRLATSSAIDLGSVFLKADFIEDSVSGESRIDLREARIVVTPSEQIDLSIGKQVNTWGVADMLFINDLFPKNWVSNFLGRDMESMKDAANSLRLTGYFGQLILDVVYHPEFAPDTTPTGCRLSVYDPNSQGLTANSSSCGTGSVFNQPESDSSETAMRLKVQLGSYELAAYGYKGFYKNPKGLQWADSSGAGTGIIDLADGMAAGYTTLTAFYPDLQATGVSVEGQLGPGIVTFESGLYQSLDDEDGDNPLIENSAMKYLLGYRMDFSAHIGAGVQWYQEQMLQYDKYEDAVAAYFPQSYDYRKKERHNTYTLRLTVKAQQETLWLNFFRYQRPEDRDAFSKLDVTKRLNDNLELVFGLNQFEGEENYEDREFGMLRNDDNLFARVKFNF